MIQFIYILLATIVIIFVSLIGVIFAWKKLEHWVEKNLHHLVSFSAGVFLIVAINVGVEAFELSYSITIIILSITLGILLMYLISKLFPEGHHHHHKNETEPHTRVGAEKMLLGDAIHNIADGILLVPAFAIDLRLGIITTIGILIHELVQEISEFFVLKEAGYSNKQALWKNFIISTTILIGVLIGYFLSSIEILIGPLLGLASGSFLYIVFVDLIPQSITYSKEERAYFQYAIWAILGIIIILAINYLSNHL